jgi:hypothetical protein
MELHPDHAHLGELKEPIYLVSDVAHYSIIKAGVIMDVSNFSELGNRMYPKAVIEGVKKADEPFPKFVPTYSMLDGRINA